jgi:hypothetical protein
MNAALQDFRMIWRAAGARREAQAVRTLALSLGAAGICAAVFIVAGTVNGGLDALQALRLLAGFAMLVLVLVWTFLFVPGSIRMNSPVNAWLLPRQRRRLLQMTAAYWLLASVGMAFGLDKWIALPAVALSVLGLALLSAGNKHVVVLLVVGGNWPWLAHIVLPPAWAAAATGPVGAIVLGILTVPAAVWALRWLYPAGGDAYLERRTDQIRRLDRFDQCGEDKQPVPEGPVALGNLPFYFVALRCDVKPQCPRFCTSARADPVTPAFADRRHGAVRIEHDRIRRADLLGRRVFPLVAEGLSAARLRRAGEARLDRGGPAPFRCDRRGALIALSIGMPRST